jgi:ribosome-binding protein aMBF1 (putative translation factor)
MRRKQFSPKSAKSKKASGLVKAGVGRSKTRDGVSRNIGRLNPVEAYERFQQLLVEARRTSGLSQQEIADRLGRPQTYVSKCERGTRRMDVVEFIEMAEVVGFDPIVFIRKLYRNGQ